MKQNKRHKLILYTGVSVSVLAGMLFGQQLEVEADTTIKSNGDTELENNNSDRYYIQKTLQEQKNSQNSSKQTENVANNQVQGASQTSGNTLNYDNGSIAANEQQDEQVQAANSDDTTSNVGTKSVGDKADTNTDDVKSVNYTVNYVASDDNSKILHSETGNGKVGSKVDVPDTLVAGYRSTPEEGSSVVLHDGADQTYTVTLERVNPIYVAFQVHEVNGQNYIAPMHFEIQVNDTGYKKVLTDHLNKLMHHRGIDFKTGTLKVKWTDDTGEDKGYDTLMSDDTDLEGMEYEDPVDIFNVLWKKTGLSDDYLTDKDGIGVTGMYNHGLSIELFYKVLPIDFPYTIQYLGDGGHQDNQVLWTDTDPDKDSENPGDAAYNHYGLRKRVPGYNDLINEYKIDYDHENHILKFWVYAVDDSTSTVNILDQAGNILKSDKLTLLYHDSDGKNKLDAFESEFQKYFDRTVAPKEGSDLLLSSDGGDISMSEDYVYNQLKKGGDGIPNNISNFKVFFDSIVASPLNEMINSDANNGGSVNLVYNIRLADIVKPDNVPNGGSNSSDNDNVNESENRIQNVKLTVATYLDGGDVNLYDEFGNLLSDRDLKADSDWLVDQILTKKNRDGTLDQYFCVSTNEFVKINQGYVYKSGSGLVSTGNKIVRLYNSHGKLVSDRALMSGTSWLFDRTSTDILKSGAGDVVINNGDNNGELMYRVATDEWVRESDIIKA